MNKSKEELSEEHSKVYVDCGESVVDAAKYDFLAGFDAAMKVNPTGQMLFDQNEANYKLLQGIQTLKDRLAISNDALKDSYNKLKCYMVGCSHQTGSFNSSTCSAHQKIIKCLKDNGEYLKSLEDEG
jgi:hypothetical protein